MLLEVNCETDFVARGDKFKELVADLAMQVRPALRRPQSFSLVFLRYVAVCLLPTACTVPMCRLIVNCKELP